ncbi:hypothetical protein S245_005931 [Arachis hypogaea]|nr:uncharacterized protein DS421_2g58500 [Arachis hypogaea]
MGLGMRRINHYRPSGIHVLRRKLNGRPCFAHSRRLLARPQEDALLLLSLDVSFLLSRFLLRQYLDLFHPQIPLRIRPRQHRNRRNRARFRARFKKMARPSRYLRLFLFSLGFLTLNLYQQWLT